MGLSIFVPAISYFIGPFSFYLYIWWILLYFGCRGYIWIGFIIRDGSSIL